MRVGRVAVVVHDGKQRAVDVARELTGWFGERGIEVGEREPDLVVSLGGDGTMLRAAQLAHANDAPLLGVNIGTTGYLTEVELGTEREALARVLADDFEIEDRMMLGCTVGDHDGQPRWVALNEVLVEREGRHRLVRLLVRIGGETLATFHADGVIVATPTGSTAYALSAGGPIVSPKAECLVVVPVSPHTVFSRPVVLASDETVEVQVQDDSGGAVVSLDGWLGDALAPTTTVRVGTHPRPLRLVRLSGPGFLERLRAKLPL